MPASLKQVAQQLPAPSAETLAGLAAVLPDRRLGEVIAASAGVQPLKQEAFQSWSPGQTWFAWCSATGTTVTMNDQAWAAWNSTVSTTAGSYALSYTTGASYVHSGTTWTAWNTPYQESEDARSEREERERQVTEDWRRQWEEQEAKREQAKARSLALLRSLLSAGQWESYQDLGWFEVRGSSGRRWRIRKGSQAGNVDLMPEQGDVREATYCAHPPDGLPDADAHAAQMLALVTDDEAFTKVANVHWGRPALRVLPGHEVRAEARQLLPGEAAA